MAEQPSAKPMGWSSSATKALRAAGRAFRFSSTVIGAGVLVGTGVSAVIANDIHKRQLTLPEEFVLDLDLRRIEVVESLASPFGRFSGSTQVTVNDMISLMEEAGKDPRVKGLLATFPDTAEGGKGKGLGGMAQVQEIRSAISRFRLLTAERQVPCVAYAQSFGGTQAYYLASAFGDIYMQPSGIFFCPGLAAQVPFFRGLLDKWKIMPLAHAREEYKNATNPITKTGFTRAHREATSKLIQGMSGQVFEAVALSRGLSLRSVRSAVDSSPMTASEAVKRGLVTETKYADEVEEMVTSAGDGHSLFRPLKKISHQRFLKAVQLKKKQEQSRKKWKKQFFGANQNDSDNHYQEASPALEKSEAEENKPELSGEGDTDMAREKLTHREEWLNHWKKEGFSAWWDAMTRSLAGDLGPQEMSPFPPSPPEPKVALVYALGAIVGTANSQSSDQIDSMKVCKHLAKLREDKAVAAVVLRIDSPGGGAWASDAIHREVSLLRKTGKKVVVSMGNVAASGGYYIACAADRIVASPGTITGSIGVTTLKIDASAFIEEQGIRVETIKAGKNADIMSVVKGLTADQDKVFNRLMDSIYKDFIDRVAEGRGMTVSAVRRLAKGRIYTGTEAKKLGLVDDLGGLNDAMKIARNLAALPEDAVVETWSGKSSPLETLRQAASGDTSAAKAFLNSVVAGAADSFINSILVHVFGQSMADVISGRALGIQARGDAVIEAGVADISGL